MENTPTSTQTLVLCSNIMFQAQVKHTVTLGECQFGGWDISLCVTCRGVYKVSSKDVDKGRWRHQMETFSALLTICAGNSPQKGQWRGALMFSLICDWITGWLNNREAGDLRRYRAHYDVTVMAFLHKRNLDHNRNIDGTVYVSLNKLLQNWSGCRWFQTQ